MSTLTKHETAIARLQQNDQNLEEMLKYIKRIWRAIKWGAPSVLAYLVGSGWIGQDVAAGLKAALGI